MRIIIISVAISLPILSGCAAFKEKTGEYVTEAVQEKIIKDVDELLSKRGLSRKEIEEVVDANNDGEINRQELLETTKSATKDAVLLETKRAIDDYITKTEKEMVDDSALKSKFNEVLLWILGLISAYLGKQIYSAKQDGKRDQRIAVLEKILQKDIDGDGFIGSNGIPVEEPKA